MGRTITVTVGLHYEKFIQSNLTAGRYNNVSEMVRAGLRRLEEDEARLSAIHAALVEGEKSGVAEDFDPATFVQKLNAVYEAEIQAI